MRLRLFAATLTVTTMTLLGGCSLVVPATQQLSKIDVAADAQAKSDLANAKVAFVSFAVTNSADPTSVTDLAEFGYLQSDGVSPVRILPGSSSVALCLDVQSSSGSYFKTTMTGTAVEGECAASDL